MGFVIKLVTISTALALTMSCAPAHAAPPKDGFPLGRGKPQISRKKIAPGVVHRTYRNGARRWTACVHAESRRRAKKISRRAGRGTRIEKISRPRIADLPGAVFGYRVCVGRWAVKSRAIRARKRFRKVRSRPYVRQEAKAGPWLIQTITVRKRHRGTLAATVGRSVAARERTSAMARRSGAIAAVNGGFYMYRSKKAPGAPKGISIVRGRLLREGRRGGTALVMRGAKARVTELAAKVKVTAADGAITRVDAVNRAIRKGERLGWFTPEFRAGRVKGRPVAGGDGVVRGRRGAGKSWLATHPGPYTVTVKVRDRRAGRRLELDARTSAVGGGVAVVRNGKKWINGRANGVTASGMIGRRHPRTLAGVDRRGRLLLATVDGRRPGHSVGATLPEAARLMRWLGARDAMNLDGGGSTTMVVRGRVRNRPSDGRERPVGDAVTVLGG